MQKSDHDRPAPKNPSLQCLANRPLLGWTHENQGPSTGDPQDPLGPKGVCVSFFCPGWNDRDYDDAIAGTRSVCGDGVVLAAAGEQCDDGNTAGDDCCSPTCQSAAVGSPCTDGDPCTSEACGAAGTCDPIAPPEDIPCRDPLNCYRAADRGQPRFARIDVTLLDDYASVGATVIKPQAVCNPASLSGATLVDPATHLTCFKITAPALAQPQRVESTSVLGTVQLELTKPKLLCLPSAKTVLP